MKRFTLRVSDLINAKIDSISKQERRSKNQMIVIACEKFIADFKDENLTKGVNKK